MPDTDMQSVKRYKTRHKHMFEGAALHRNRWREINEYLFPYAGAFLANTNEDKSEGRKKDSKIINTEASYSRLVYTNGMTGGMTSASQQWFTLALEDKDLMNFDPVKIWLHDVRDMMFSVYQKSNFYDAIANMHEEVGTYGFNTMIMDFDPNTVIRFRPMTIGEGYVALDEQFRPNTLHRSTG